MDIEKIKEAIEPIAKRLDVSIYKVVYEKENGKNYLRVFLEKEDYSLDLDTCVKASEAISPLLDELDPIEDEYFLEVASAGERELVTKEDFTRAINMYILVDVSERVLDYDELVGDLVKVNEDSIELKINLKGRMKVVTIPFNIIEKANLTFKF
ncbi:MAG: ribosome maturation factor RimP [Bacilli bacterium]|nr:ribosome maturation factor RimP [Bacilli bacterium]